MPGRLAEARDPGDGRREQHARPDLPTGPVPPPPVLAWTQVSLSALGGIVVGLPVAFIASWGLFPLVSWDVACVIYMTWVWRTIWPLDAEHTARFAVPEDPTRAAADLITLGAAVVSLVAVGFVLGRASNSQGAEQALLAGLGVASVVLSWAVVHTLHTLRYARIYYTGPDDDVDFNQHEPPCYVDFAYLSFTIGMTFQVSDTDLRTNEIRKTALRHALLSFVFVTGIVASTVNLVANLGGH
jgi:uncharacterized membrane protein